MKGSEEGQSRHTRSWKTTMARHKKLSVMFWALMLLFALYTIWDFHNYQRGSLPPASLPPASLPPPSAHSSTWAADSNSHGGLKKYDDLHGAEPSCDCKAKEKMVDATGEATKTASYLFETTPSSQPQAPNKGKPKEEVENKFQKSQSKIAFIFAGVYAVTFTITLAFPVILRASNTVSSVARQLQLLICLTTALVAILDFCRGGLLLKAKGTRWSDLLSNLNTTIVSFLFVMLCHGRLGSEPPPTVQGKKRWLLTVNIAISSFAFILGSIAVGTDDPDGENEQILKILRSLSVLFNVVSYVAAFYKLLCINMNDSNLKKSLYMIAVGWLVSSWLIYFLYLISVETIIDNQWCCCPNPKAGWDVFPLLTPRYNENVFCLYSKVGQKTYNSMRFQFVSLLCEFGVWSLYPICLLVFLFRKLPAEGDGLYFTMDQVEQSLWDASLDQKVVENYELGNILPP